MKLFEDFSSQTIDQWQASVERELKGLSFADTLRKKDDIENLDFSKFEGPENNTRQQSLNYTRAARSKNNDWEIGQRIEVKDEKVANKFALLALNQGSTALTFVLQKKNILWSALFEGIALDFISVRFETLEMEQINDLSTNFSKFSKKPLVFANDPIGNNQEFVAPDTSIPGAVHFKVNAYGIHQAGANAIEETAFALALGHEYLHQLLAKNFSIDDASAMIRFDFGLGAKYFIETAKFRVFRNLWANIVDAYAPKENCSHACYITAQTGFVNKSLKDPYTNLLRQTTEVMSAVLGGANEICVRAYDEFAQTKNSELSERMALNISNILKEESYFDKVIDPLGGSYNLEKLSEQLQDKTWNLFQAIEKAGGIQSAEGQVIIRDKVIETAKKRIETVVSAKEILIGMNKYPNPDEKENTWQDIPSYLGLEALILEKHIQ